MWKVIAAVWDDKFKKLTVWKIQHGHTCVPISDPDLGSWVSKQRQSYKRGKLATEKVNALNCIDFTWSTSESDWDDKFKQLCEWKTEHGHVLVPFNEGGLGWWSNTQRQSKRKGKLSKDREVRLQNIGFVWNPSIRRTRSKKDQVTNLKRLSLANEFQENAEWSGLEADEAPCSGVPTIEDEGSMSVCSSDSFSPCVSNSVQSSLAIHPIRSSLPADFTGGFTQPIQIQGVHISFDEASLRDEWQQEQPINIVSPSSSVVCTTSRLLLATDGQPRTSADILRLMMM
jgi:Helicase associated domain